jgi:hypothetical protein
VGEGQIRVAIVVDPGPGGPGGPAATCLVVARGTTGAQLLVERAAALGVARPRYADSGLLCAFDGYPATGCGERTADGYRYWAYFSGTSGSWVYGSGNPFLRRLADGDVEGWRFVDGTGTGQDPPPRLSPSGLFPPLVTPAPPVPPPVAPPVAAGGVTNPPGPPGVVAPVGSAGAEPAGSVPSGATAAPSDAPSADAPSADAGVGEGVGPGRYGSSDDAAAGDPASDAAPSELAADVAASSSSPAGPIGAVVAGVVIAVLVGATVRRARTRA